MSYSLGYSSGKTCGTGVRNVELGNVFSKRKVLSRRISLGDLALKGKRLSPTLPAVFWVFLGIFRECVQVDMSHIHSHCHTQ